MLFDLQLHGVQGLEGIDEDIQKEIMSEMEPEGETQSEEPKKEEEPATEKSEKVEESEKVQDADADSDKKQNEPVAKEETEENEEEEATETGNVPYKRFKSVNEKRKALASENEELKRKIEELTKTSSNPKPVEKKVDTSNYKAEGYNQEQMEKIVAYAINQVKTKHKMTDADVDAIKYGDDKVKSMAFERMVQEEIDAGIAGVRKYQQDRADLDRQWRESAKDFGELNDRVMAMEDSKERLDYILNAAFEKETPRMQRCLQESLGRLQHQRGVYQDIELITAYVNKANRAYDKEHEKATNVAKKFDKAQGLPKAPNIQGGANTDNDFTMDDIKAALESGDSKAWDKIPQAIKDKIMRGEPI